MISTDASAADRIPYPIGVGFIGLSAKRGWASVAHLPGLRALPTFDVRALSASTRENAEAAAAAYGVPHACGSAQELVERDDVDLVVVTVKVPHHFELVSAALEAGKHVLCEWPLGNGLAEAQALAALAKQKGVRGFVGLQARSAPPVRYVRDLVRDGAIGRVLSTTIIGSGDNWGALIDPAYSYSLDPSQGATLLSVPFGHTVDGLCFVLGEFDRIAATMAVRRRHVHVAGTGERLENRSPDQIALSGRLESGAIVSMHYRGGLSAGTNFLWEINGTEGDIVLRGPNGHLQYGRVTVERSGASGALVPSPIPRRYLLTDTDPAARAHTVAEAYVHIEADLTAGTHSSPTFEDAVQRHRVLECVHEAAASGQSVEVH